MPIRPHLYGQEEAVPKSTYSDQTRDRILEVAYDLFSDSGYEQTSVRSIVARAGTNIASVNYHFGGKDNLYAEVLALSFGQLMEGIEADLEGAAAGRNGEEAVFAFACARIRRGLSEGSFHPPRILGWELVCPVADHREMFRNNLNRVREKLVALLNPLFSDAMTPEQKGFAAGWFFEAIKPSPPVAMDAFDLLGPRHEPDHFEQTVAYLAQAAMAGVRTFVAPPTGYGA